MRINKSNNPDCNCSGHEPFSGVVRHVTACCDKPHYDELNRNQCTICGHDRTSHEDADDVFNEAGCAECALNEPKDVWEHVFFS